MFLRRTVLRAAGAGALAAVAGCSGAGGGADGTTTGGTGATVVETTSVSMVDTQFDPRNIRVEAGAEVTWTNEDDVGHTVTSASDNWSLDVEVAGGERATHAFPERGVYDAYCRFHGSADLSGMSMRIAVGDAAIEAPLTDGGGEDGGY